ncbi:MAG TPA: nuclear transport factor 2 family protein [Flavisolibacter sp.]|jgi:ketosteroid isomerase-like protein|nr:nuclear transport factor 2 family protein [Flavisolibacter sp.]
MKRTFLFIPVLLIMVSGCVSSRQVNSGNPSSDIIALMNKAEADWNNGNLDGYMALYDDSSTFMLPGGPVGINGMRENYQRGFFNGSKPKQNLKYEEMIIRPLGKDHALLTGKFILSGNNLKQLAGRYSVLFVRRPQGWRILHDHSS